MNKNVIPIERGNMAKRGRRPVKKYTPKGDVIMKARKSKFANRDLLIDELRRSGQSISHTTILAIEKGMPSSEKSIKRVIKPLGLAWDDVVAFTATERDSYEVRLSNDLPHYEYTNQLCLPLKEALELPHADTLRALLAWTKRHESAGEYISEMFDYTGGEDIGEENQILCKKWNTEEFISKQFMLPSTYKIWRGDLEQQDKTPEVTAALEKLDSAIDTHLLELVGSTPQTGDTLEEVLEHQGYLDEYLRVLAELGIEVRGKVFAKRVPVTRKWEEGGEEYTADLLVTYPKLLLIISKKERLKSPPYAHFCLGPKVPEHFTLLEHGEYKAQLGFDWPEEENWTWWTPWLDDLRLLEKTSFWGIPF